jgi:hypothetical protein
MYLYSENSVLYNTEHRILAFFKRFNILSLDYKPSVVRQCIM